MATPSLGYAIGLNVKRKDIFKEAGENLSKNLDRLAEQQDRAKKEKKDKEARVLERMMKMGEGTLNRRYEPERIGAYKDMESRVFTMLDTGADEADILKEMLGYNEKYNALKYNSDNLTADETAFYRNSAYVKPRAADIVFGGDKALDEDQKLELRATGYIPLDGGGFLNSPVQSKPVAKTLSENKIDENFLIAQMASDAQKRAEWDKQEKEKAKKDNTYKPTSYEQAITETTYKQKKIPGYEPMAGTVLEPGRAFFISNIVNKVINEESVVENALIEYEKTGKSMAKALNDKMNNFPGIDLDQAKAMVARDFIAENYYEPWAKENAQFIQSNKTPRDPGGTSKKDEISTSTFYDSHLTTEGMAKAKAKGLNLQQALDDPEFKDYIAGSGPTVSLETSANEPLKIDIKGEPTYVNPDKIWLDSSGKYHIIYDKALSSSVSAQSYDGADVVLSKSDMQTLLSLKRAKDPLAALEVEARRLKLPTPMEYAGKTSGTTSSGGRATVPGFPTR